MPIATRVAQFVDTTTVPDLEGALSIVLNANNAFDSLPLDIRKKCGFSPVEFLKYVSDPANTDSLVKAGILIKKQEAPVVPATPADEVKGDK